MEDLRKGRLCEWVCMAGILIVKSFDTTWRLDEIDQKHKLETCLETLITDVHMG